MEEKNLFCVGCQILGYGYIGARSDTTQQSGQTTDKEAKRQNITVYVSGCAETDTTAMLCPSTDGQYFNLLATELFFLILAHSVYKM